MTDWDRPHIHHRHPDGYFLLRAAGVARRGDDVLLHRAEGDDIWALPGGRVLFGETAEEAIRREMLEETSAEIVVGPLVAIVENFFTHEQLDRALDEPGESSYHEMGLYFHMDVPAALMDQEEFWGVELEGSDDEFRLEFRWVAREHVRVLGVVPEVIHDLLEEPFDPVVRHIVQNA